MDANVPFKKFIAADEEHCIIELNRYYQLCQTAQNCASCVMNGYCGWNTYRNSCYPKRGDFAACEIPGGFITRHAQCLNNVFNNSNTVNPELRYKLGGSNQWKQEDWPAYQPYIASGDFANVAFDARTITRPELRIGVHDTMTPVGWNPVMPTDFEIKSGNLGNLDGGAQNIVTAHLPKV